MTSPSLPASSPPSPQAQIQPDSATDGTGQPKRVTDWTRIDEIGEFRLGQWAALIDGYDYPRDPKDDPGKRPWSDTFFAIRGDILLGKFQPTGVPQDRVDRYSMIRRDELTDYYRQKKTKRPRALFVPSP